MAAKALSGTAHAPDFGVDDAVKMGVVQVCPRCTMKSSVRRDRRSISEVHPSVGGGPWQAGLWPVVSAILIIR